MAVKDLLVQSDFHSPLACGQVDIFIPGVLNFFVINNKHVLFSVDCDEQWKTESNEDA